VGNGNLNGITYQPTRDFPIHPATFASDYDKNTISESLDLRYTKIPFTTLFADKRFQQEKIAQTDSDIQPAPALSFAEDTTYTSRLYDARAGLSTSPWQSVSFSAHYRRYEDDSRYKTNEVAQPVGGYPGFISWRDLLTDEAEAKLSLRPLNWLKTMFTYQFVTTDYKQDTRTAFTLVPRQPIHRADFCWRGNTILTFTAWVRQLLPSNDLSFAARFPTRTLKLSLTARD